MTLARLFFSGFARRFLAWDGRRGRKNEQFINYREINCNVKQCLQR